MQLIKADCKFRNIEAGDVVVLGSGNSYLVWQSADNSFYMAVALTGTGMIGLQKDRKSIDELFINLTIKEHYSKKDYMLKLMQKEECENV